MQYMKAGHAMGDSGLHPISVFAFFFAAIVLSMAFSSMPFICVNFLSACMLSVAIEGMRAFRFIGSLIAFSAAMSFVSPFLNASGDVVLFSYFGGRAYTLNAVIYGASIAFVFSSVLLWFKSYSKLITMDRFNELFASRAPKLCLLLGMVNQMVLRFSRRSKEALSASSINSGDLLSKRGSRAFRIRASGRIMLNMVAWSMEASATTSDSMVSRGFGLSGKTHYRQYRFGPRDVLFLAVLAVLLVCTLALNYNGAAFSTYIPHFTETPLSFDACMCALSYFCLLQMLTISIIWRSLLCRFYLSKI